MIGRIISHYRVLRFLGRGGMGMVYEAEDTLLGRRVALKVLLSEVAGDAPRRQRLEREARAVAALNHPNIVTLYSIEQADGQHLITMELVDGRPLATAIPRHGLPVKDLLKYAVQIADALSTAHERGITHRDLKPANVMLSTDGRVKVLDFGLAKLREPTDADSTTTQTGHAAVSDTGEGRIVGTLAYMSPEQAEGKSVDHRSDIFSFGVLLYEMATGERPFKGDSKASVLASIIKDTPRFATEVRSGLPLELARIIRRCLQKQPADRYQSARDLRNELAELEYESESGDLPFRPMLALPRRRPWRLLIMGASVMGAAVLVALWAMRLPPFIQSDVPETGAPTPVTSATGWEHQPALSSDGGIVAYSSNEKGNPDIFVITSGGGQTVPLAEHPATDEEPAWFPDSSQLAFASDRNGRWNIWTVSPLGGPAIPLVTDGRDPAISRDYRIAFTRVDSAGDSRVMVAPLDDVSKAIRVSQDIENTGSGSQAEEDPAWSPDGRWICYFSDRTLWVVPADGGRHRQLLTQPTYDIEPTWLDDRTILFSSLREGTWALWWAQTDDGTPRRLTQGAGPERHPAVSRDGSRLAFSSFRGDTNLVTHDIQTGKERVTGTNVNESFPVFSPDGLTLCFSKDGTRAATTELWRQGLNANGDFVGPSSRLTDQPGAVSHPDFSPDGKLVAYQRVVKGRRDIWMVPASGLGEPVQLTSEIEDDSQPSWAPAGLTLVFVSMRGGANGIWTLPVTAEGPAGPATRLLSGPGSSSSPVWSPDGRQIAYVSGGQAKEVYLASSDGTGAPRPLTTGAQAYYVRWHPKGESLFVSGAFGESVATIRLVDATTGSNHQFEPPIRIGQPLTVPAFDVRYDGRIVAFSRGAQSGDVYMAEIRRPRR